MFNSITCQLHSVHFILGLLHFPVHIKGCSWLGDSSHMKKPKHTVEFVSKKQGDGRYKIQRITTFENGTSKKATIMKNLTSQVAKDWLFLKKRNKV